MRIIRPDVDKAIDISKVPVDPSNTATIDLPPDRMSAEYRGLFDELSEYGQRVLQSIAAQTKLGDALVAIEFTSIQCTLIIVEPKSADDPRDRIKLMKHP